MQITLGKTWEIGELLGDGGFGVVYEALGPDGEEAVAKFVPGVKGADRELLFGDTFAASGARYVIPVLDTGTAEGQHVLIMRRAATDLRSHLWERGGQLEVSEAIAVLRNVATALTELDGRVVHRDLKPENVLLLDGEWCISDFGISRYADATTADDTRKFSFTEPYAAPEQWIHERATSATDVYAFGVLAYELLSGERPFLGPDFRDQHLRQTAPALSVGTQRLKFLVEECLMKPKEARPTPAQLLVRLAQVEAEPTSPGARKLAEANRAEAARRAAADVAARSAQEQLERSQAMFAVAQQTFAALPAALLEAIAADAPLTQVDDGGPFSNPMAFVADLHEGRLGVTKPASAERWDGPFEVFAAAAITVRTEQSRSRDYQGRSHSLWFCDAHEEGRFSWYELGFMESPFGRTYTHPVAPQSLSPRDAAIAFHGVIGTTQLGWPVTEIDRADSSEFVDRWLSWFADAAAGTLARPSTMPERPTQGTWRRS